MVDLVLFFFLQLRFGWIQCVLYTQVHYHFLPKLAGDFLYYRNIKESSMHTLCAFGNLLKILMQNHFQGHRKLSSPLKGCSVTWVMVGVVTWIPGATSVVFVAYASMLNLFARYVSLETQWERCKTMFHVSQNNLSDHRSHICTPAVCTITVQIQDLNYFLNKTHICGGFIFCSLVWLYCAASVFTWNVLLQV